MSTAVCGHNNPYTGGRHRPLVRRAIPVVLLLLVAGCLNTAPTHIRGIAFEPPEGVIEGDEIVFGVNPLAFPDRAVFYWELGDGAAVHGPQVTHTYAEEGTYTVRLTVVGPDGSAGTATREVVILHRNMPPVAHAGPGRNALVHASVAFDGSGSSDPEPELLAYAWDFGDDDTGSGVAPSHNYTALGNYTVTLTVTDDGGLSDTATTWVNVSLRRYSITFTTQQRVRQPTGYTAETETTSWNDKNATHNLTSAEFRLVWHDVEYWYKDPVFSTPIAPVPNQEDDFTLRVTPPHGPQNTTNGDNEELVMSFADINAVPEALGPLNASSETEVRQWLAGQGYTRSTGFGTWGLAVTCDDAPPDEGVILTGIADDDPGNDWTLTVTYTYYVVEIVEITV